MAKQKGIGGWILGMISVAILFYVFGYSFSKGEKAAGE